MEDRNAQIFVVGPDPSLEPEFQSALDGVKNLRALVRYYENPRQALEGARSRQPDLVCFQMDQDTERLKQFADDLAYHSPHTAIVGVFHRDSFDNEDLIRSTMIEAIRSQVKDFLRRPLSSLELEEVLQRVLQKRKSTGRNRRGRVISIISNKGGVGKSTLAVNLACEMALRHPDRVLLIDASLQLGVCAPMLDLKPRATLVDAVREIDRLDETMLHQMAVRHECGLRLIAAPNSAAEATEITEEALSRILSLAQRDYDYIFVDTFPMLDGSILSILDASHLAYVVFNGTVPNVIGTDRFLETLANVGFAPENLRLVLSQSYRNFPGNLNLENIEARLERELDYVVSYQPKLMTALNTGKPYILYHNRTFGFGRSIHEMADDLEEGLAPGKTIPAAVGEPREKTVTLEPTPSQSPPVVPSEEKVKHD